MPFSEFSRHQSSLIGEMSGDPALGKGRVDEPVQMVLTDEKHALFFFLGWGRKQLFSVLSGHKGARPWSQHLDGGAGRI